MNGRRAKALRKANPDRPNPGRKHGGDPNDPAPQGVIRLLLNKGRKTTPWWRS